MSQKFNFTIATLVMVAGIGFAAPDVMGQVTMQFPVNRDVGIDAWSADTVNSPADIETLSNAGTADSSVLPGTIPQIQGTIRALKAEAHGLVIDFDTAAMEAFLLANPGAATWTLNIRNGPANGAQQQLPADVTILTVESTNDWAEGDGLLNFENFNWTSGTAAATYFYAQTVHNGGVLDTGSSLQWIDPDSGPYLFTTRVAEFTTGGDVYNGTDVPNTVGIGNGGTLGINVGPTPEFTNTALLTAEVISDAFDADGYASVPLDDVIVDALLNDENNRGLRFGPLAGTNNGVLNNNWTIFSRECDSGVHGQCAAFLEVSIIPDSPDGDFDGDLDVDGADFLEWQRTLGDTASLDLWETNFSTTASTASASAAGVPEPSSLLLVLLCSSAMLCTRCGNRKTA